MFGMVDVAVDKIGTIYAVHIVIATVAGGILSSIDIMGTIGSGVAVDVADLVGSVDIVDAIEVVGTVGAVDHMTTIEGVDSMKAVCTVDLVYKVGFHCGKSILVRIFGRAE